MNRVHIVGRKNHGKTTLMIDLVRELTELGYRVGTIKHTRHLHDLDTPGTDSDRHRRAGAVPSAIVTGGLIGVFVPADPTTDAYERLASLYDDCDLVLVEGDRDTTAPKIEVWRAGIGTPCLALEDPGIGLVVTDDPLPAHVPVVPRAGLDRIVRFILECCPQVV